MIWVRTAAADAGIVGAFANSPIRQFANSIMRRALSLSSTFARIPHIFFIFFRHPACPPFVRWRRDFSYCNTALSIKLEYNARNFSALIRISANFRTFFIFFRPPALPCPVEVRFSPIVYGLQNKSIDEKLASPSLACKASRFSDWTRRHSLKIALCAVLGNAQYYARNFSALAGILPPVKAIFLLVLKIDFFSRVLKGAFAGC